jgi:hypothetical protein
VQLGIHAAFCSTDLATALLFCTQATSRAVLLQAGRIDHDRLRIGALGGQAHRDPSEDPVIALTFPAIVEGLRRFIFPRCIAPPQPIAIEKDYAAKNPQVINTRAAMALGKEGANACHLRFDQPEQVAHQSGLLAMPESRKRRKINGSGD